MFANLLVNLPDFSPFSAHVPVSGDVRKLRQTHAVFAAGTSSWFADVTRKGLQVCVRTWRTWKSIQFSLYNLRNAPSQYSLFLYEMGHFVSLELKYINFAFLSPPNMEESRL